MRVLDGGRATVRQKTN